MPRRTCRVEAAGRRSVRQIFHPIAERLLEQCDAVLRIGVPSQAAGLLVQVAQRLGLKTYRRVAEVSGCET